MHFTVEEEVAWYDPALRMSRQEDGKWPHSNHYHFNEAVVAAHFVLRGYQVLRDFSSTRLLEAGRPVAVHSTRLLHDVVGPDVSDFFRSDLATATDNGSGEPDLFVFREEHPNDSKFHYDDPRLWFFVEVKGPGDVVGAKQKLFWHEVAERLGRERIRLFRTAPLGELFAPDTIEY